MENATGNTPSVSRNKLYVLNPPWATRRRNLHQLLFHTIYLMRGKWRQTSMRVTLGYYWWSSISTLWENSYHQVHMYTSPWLRTLNLPIYLPGEDLVRALRRVLSYICDINLEWGGSVMKKWVRILGRRLLDFLSKSNGVCFSQVLIMENGWERSPPEFTGAVNHSRESCAMNFLSEWDRHRIHRPAHLHGSIIKQMRQSSFTW